MNNGTTTWLTAGLLAFRHEPCLKTLTARIALALQDKGYEFEQGEVGDDGDEQDQGWWFTWVSPTFKMSGVECGATHTTWEGAVWDGFEHFMRDAHIPPADGYETDCGCDDDAEE